LAIAGRFENHTFGLYSPYCRCFSHMGGLFTHLESFVRRIHRHCGIFGSVLFLLFPYLRYGARIANLERAVLLTVLPFSFRYFLVKYICCSNYFYPLYRLMKIANKTIELQTQKIFDFIDITDQVKNIVRDSNIKDGIVNIQILHTSAALIVNENEPLLLEDIKANLEKNASQNSQYQHDDLTKRTVNVCQDECVNGHSHCNAIHLLANATLNLIDGELQLGQWQSIILVELDRPKPRKIQVQIIGE